VGPPVINFHDWEVCHGESRITVSSRCPDTFDKIVYVYTLVTLKHFLTNFSELGVKMSLKLSHFDVVCIYFSDMKTF
jgi:hypothetical protein